VEAVAAVMAAEAMVTVVTMMAAMLDQGNWRVAKLAVRRRSRFGRADHQANNSQRRQNDCSTVHDSLSFVQFSWGETDPLLAAEERSSGAAQGYFARSMPIIRDCALSPLLIAF
jgi:hypothetical protein